MKGEDEYKLIFLTLGRGKLKFYDFYKTTINTVLHGGLVAQYEHDFSTVIAAGSQAKAGQCN